MQRAAERKELIDSCNEHKNLIAGGTAHWDVNVKAEILGRKEKQWETNI